MTRGIDGNGVGAIENGINLALVTSAFDVIEKNGHRVVMLNDIVMAAVEAALRLGLSGAEAERLAWNIQEKLVECLARNGVGIIDSEDGWMWLPETEREAE